MTNKNHVRAFDLTERELAVANETARIILAVLESRESPKVSGKEAARLLGISYSKFRYDHFDEGDIFYIVGTKRFWRKDVLRLKEMREIVRRRRVI